MNETEFKNCRLKDLRRLVNSSEWSTTNGDLLHKLIDNLCNKVKSYPKCIDELVGHFGAHVKVSQLFYALQKAEERKKDTDEVKESSSETSDKIHGGSGASGEVDNPAESPSQQKDNNNNNNNKGGAQEKHDRAGKSSTEGGATECAEAAHDNDASDAGVHESRGDKNSGAETKPVAAGLEQSSHEIPDAQGAMHDTLEKKVAFLKEKLEEKRDRICAERKIREQKRRKAAKQSSSKNLRSGALSSASYTELSAGGTGKDRRVNILQKFIQNFSTLEGENPTRKIEPKALVRELVQKSYRISRCYKSVAKEKIFITADVSGSCSSSAKGTVEACEIIARTLSNVAIITHVNGHAENSLIDGKMSSEEGRSISEIIAEHKNVTAMIGFGDHDAENCYEKIAKQCKKVIIFDSFGANDSCSRIWRKEKRWTHVVGVNSLDRVIQAIKTLSLTDKRRTK